MLKVEKTILTVVDVQGKLAHLMHEKEALFENFRKVIRGIQVLGIPIIWVEQNPKGLGPTIPEIADLLSDVQPIAKLSFNCCRNDHFVQALKATARDQVLLAGIDLRLWASSDGVSIKHRKMVAVPIIQLTAFGRSLCC